ncbi:hypothetical protein HK101_001574 [Irineochytrium annulatum]|nr:hypothetical protein HK101_001574 [Irineochytrium annulatum]
MDSSLNEAKKMVKVPAAQGRPEKQKRDPKLNVEKEWTGRIELKHTLDSPYTYKWPILAEEDNEKLLTELCQVFEPVGRVQHAVAELRSLAAVNRNKRKRVEETTKAKEVAQHVLDAIDETTLDIDARMRLKKEQKKQERQKKRKTDTAQPNTAIVSMPARASQMPVEPSPQPPTIAPEVPLILSSLILGVNKITTTLERIIVSPTSSTIPARLIIFICRDDVGPPHLYAHLPTTAEVASLRKGDLEGVGRRYVVCPLMEGAEGRVCEALGVKRLVAFAVKANSLHFASIAELVQRVLKPCKMPWLAACKPVPGPHVTAYRPTRIKTLKVKVGRRVKGDGKGKRKQVADIRGKDEVGEEEDGEVK